MILEKGVAANPQNPYLSNNLAWTYMEYQSKDIDKAMRMAQKAYEKLPNNPAVIDTLGWIYYNKNMYTRAAWLLNQAIKIDSKNPHIIDHFQKVKRALRKIKGIKAI